MVRTVKLSSDFPVTLRKAWKNQLYNVFSPEMPPLTPEEKERIKKQRYRLKKKLQANYSMSRPERVKSIFEKLAAAD